MIKDCFTITHIVNTVNKINAVLGETLLLFLFLSISIKRYKQHGGLKRGWMGFKYTKNEGEHLQYSLSPGQTGKAIVQFIVKLHVDRIVGFWMTTKSFLKNKLMKHTYLIPLFIVNQHPSFFFFFDEEIAFVNIWSQLRFLIRFPAATFVLQSNLRLIISMWSHILHQ